MIKKKMTSSLSLDCTELSFVWKVKRKLIYDLRNFEVCWSTKLCPPRAPHNILTASFTEVRTTSKKGVVVMSLNSIW